MRMNSGFYVTILILFNIHNCFGNSIDKFCGNGNDIKEVVFYFHEYQGDVPKSMLWTTQMPSKKDSLIWLYYLETQMQVATLGQSGTKSIKFDDTIATSIGYACMTDGAVSISIGNPDNALVIIGFSELWTLKSEKRYKQEWRTKNGGKLILSVVLYDECQERCQRSVDITLSSGISGMRYREMDISSPSGSNDAISLGLSCALNVPLRIYKNDNSWNFELVATSSIDWSSGSSKIASGVELELGSRSNICGLLGENDASMLMILGIMNAVVIALFLFYMQLRRKIYNFNLWRRIEARVNAEDRDKRGGMISLQDIGTTVLIHNEFYGDDMNRNQENNGIDDDNEDAYNEDATLVKYISVHPGQTCVILERINDEYVKVKKHDDGAIGVIPVYSFRKEISYSHTPDPPSLGSQECNAPSLSSDMDFPPDTYA